MTVADVGPAVRVEQPGSVEEAARLLADTTGPLLFRGGGTKQQWGGRPAEPAVVVETAGLSRLLAHNPADLTVRVQGGMPLRELQEVLGTEGQWLALDPPSEVAGATVGGLLATGDSGPRRLRYGAMRDLVIGVTLVLADGTVARSGGTVIKNVAGYDLSKLLYGSLGTLGLVAEVVLRLHPRPDTSATATLPCPAGAVTELTVRLLASPLEPAALDWVQAAGERVAVRFEGTAAGVDAQRTAAGELLADAVGATAEWLTGAEEEALWREFAAAHRPVGAVPDMSADTSSGAGTGVTLAAVGTLPTRTADVARALTAAGQRAGVDTQLAARPGLGLHTARFTGSDDAVATAFTTWREQLLGFGASVVLHERPPGVDAAMDARTGAVGPPPSSAQLLRALKARLDPAGRCAPGRLGSWC